MTSAQMKSPDGIVAARQTDHLPRDIHSGDAVTFG